MADEHEKGLLSNDGSKKAHFSDEDLLEREKKEAEACVEFAFYG